MPSLPSVHLYPEGTGEREQNKPKSEKEFLSREGVGKTKLTMKGKEQSAELGKNILGREATYAKALSRAV